VKQFWISLRRLAWMLRVGLRHAIHRGALPLVERWPRLEKTFYHARLEGPERLRVMLEEIGGTFIKFGQMLALQPDILSLEYCNALFKLLDQVDPFDFVHVEHTIGEELGPPDEVFDSIEREPLATASVGQVHTAWLDGQKVAVKVQRPNVRAEFMSDIRMMTVAMWLIRTLRLKIIYWMLEPMNEFVSWTQEELDYRYEARYSEELRSNALDAAAQYVPKVYTEYTTRRTLVVEFLEGATLLGYLRARERDDEERIREIESQGFDRRRFASHIIENFLSNAFRHGIYHADLHPANLMILKDSVVGYIDFGITGVLSPYARRHLVKMTLALAQGDMEMFNEAFLQITVHGPGSDLPGFRRGLDELALGWYEETGTGRRLRANFTRIMTEMLTLSRQTDVMPERDIIKYIRSSIAIDGLITRFEPDFDLGQYLAGSLTRYIRWEKRRSRFTLEHLLDFQSAAGRLLSSGAERASEWLDRLGTGELAAFEAPPPPAGRGLESLRARSLELAACVVGAGVLVAAHGSGGELGWNLLTAELAFGAGAFGLLAFNLLSLGSQSA